MKKFQKARDEAVSCEYGETGNNLSTEDSFKAGADWAYGWFQEYIFKLDTDYKHQIDLMEQQLDLTVHTLELISGTYICPKTMTYDICKITDCCLERKAALDALEKLKEKYDYE